ncbi:MAG TPA: T9SS type A sorting domain-containing protein, partial [Saprospiraceae bacterium]|nr:T9SS type A sorting domain-containing protein [Saprospiraceae bacterium]
MKDGYEDQFNIAEDWINIPDTVALQWQRGDFSELSPPPSNYPSADIATDLGRVALYTNNFSDEFSERNVAGHHWLKSPEMDLSAFSDIDLSYDVWAYGGWDSSVKECYLEFDQQRWPLEQIYENLSGQFNRKSSYALDVRNIERKHVRFVIHLWNDPDSIQYAISLKAALDGFKLTGKLINDNDLLGQDPEIEVYPNPAGDFLILRNRIKEPLRIRISDITGCEYYLSSNDEEQFQFSLDDFPPGHYFINLFASESQKMYTKSFIKAGPEH